MQFSQELDGIDVKIIKEIVRDSNQSASELSKKLGIPSSTIYFRTHRMEKMGVIKGYTTRIDRTKLGLRTLAIVELQVSTNSDAEEVYKEFEKMSGLMSMYSTAGGVDAVLLIAGSSLKQINERVTKLRKIKGVVGSKTLIVLNAIREHEIVLE